MKKIILCVILILAISFSFASCKKDDYKKALDLLDGGSYKEAYEMFKELGDYKSSEWYLKGFKQVPSSVYLKDAVLDITYGEDGLPSRIVCTFGDLDDPHEKTAIDFEYDENGRLIKAVKSFLLDEDSEDDPLVCNISYNANGQIAEEEYVYPIGSATTVTYTYDENGNLTRVVDSNTRFGESSDDYYYDEDGNLIRRVHTSSSGEQLTYNKEYDESGKLIIEEIPELHGIVSVHEYTYDSQGRVAVDDVLYDTTNIQPGVWYGISCRRYTYTYDEMGNIIKVTRADEDGEAYIYEEYEYDEDGNLIEKRGGLANVTIERELIYMSIEISAEANEIFERIIGINTK